MKSRTTISLVLAFLVAACGYGGATTAPTTSATTIPVTQAPPTAAPVSLDILAAASLKGVLDSLKAAYETANPGTTLTISTDSSSALETKIEQGAPADVFLSADTTNPKKLVDGGFAAGAAVVFAGNTLALIVPKDNPAGITTAADLAKPGVKVIAAGDEVPITKYATQLVKNLAQEAGYPAGFEELYAANVVSKEENVKAVVAKIELGEGDVAIVYATDAKASTKVTPIAVPPTSAVPASYAGVVIKASANTAAAQAFLTWLTTADAQAFFAGFGFLPPTS